MASKRREFGKFKDDLYLDNVVGTWKNTHSRGDSLDKADSFEGRGNKHIRGDRSSEDEYSGTPGSHRSNSRMRGSYRTDSMERKPYNYEEGSRFSGRRFSEKDSPFSREGKETPLRFEERELERIRNKRFSRTNSGSRERSPPSRRDSDSIGLLFDNERKNPGLNFDIGKREVFKRNKRHSRSRSLSRKKRSLSRSSSGSSSGSSRSHSSDSSSSHRRSRERSYSRHSRGESKSPRHSSRERFKPSISPQNRSRGGSPYKQEHSMPHSTGWYPNQGFNPQGPNPPPNFTGIPPITHQPVYPQEDPYNQNYQNQGFPNNYQQFPSYEATSNNYYASMQPNFQPNPPPPSQDYNMGGPPQGQTWDGMIGYPDTSMPPPIQQPPLPVPNPSSSSQAVEQELIQQKRTLSKQREDYIKKSSSLNRELNRLKDQKRELLQENSKDNERILRENAKLQNEIQQKLKAINNVIEMLSGIIGDSSEGTEKDSKTSDSKSSEKKKLSDSKPDKYKRSDRSSSSPEVTEIKVKNEKPSVNLVHYDPELHWCADCNIFPRTAVDYLNHLHTEEHKQKIATLKVEDQPWHLNQPKEKVPTFNKNAPNKRIPIRGLQFFIPATAWFCKLCKSWIGDLHCASNHLKSDEHTNNYNEYTSQNPHWEVDWLSDRTRSYERTSENKTRLSEIAKNEIQASPLQSERSNLTSLSDQILAMLAANTKNSRESKSKVSRSSSSDSSSSSSSSDKDSKKSKKKKRKKSKKKSKKDEDKSSPVQEKKVEESKNDPEYFTSEYEIPVKIPQRRPDVDGDDKIIREWMVPPDNADREMTSSLKGRLKQKHESEQKKRDDSRYKDDKKDKYNERKHDRSREYKDYRERELRESRRRDSSRDKKSPDIRGKHHDREADHKTLEERWRTEKPQGKIWAPGKDDEDEIETNFEKRTSESAAKKKDVKKPPLMSLPKAKLPFIGRMPILKKKPSDQKEDSSKEDKKEDLRKEKEREEKKPSFIWPDLPNLPDPPSLSAEVNDPVPNIDVNQPLPKSTLIISKRPRLIDPEPPKKNVERPKIREDILGEQDMDIEDDTPKDELHKDFKDALELLFPGESTDKEKVKEDESKEEKAEEQVQQETMVIHPNYIGHPMMQPYMSGDGMFRPDQARYGYPGAQDYSGYGEQAPPGYMTGYPPYGGYMMDGSGSAGNYMQGCPPPQPPYNPPTYPEPPPKIPDVPPPPGLEDTSQDDMEEAEMSPPPQQTGTKRKNPLSQRMRRHLQKKKAQEEADKNDQNEDSEHEREEISKEERSSEMSDLAMLGIDEEDITAQSFH